SERRLAGRAALLGRPLPFAQQRRSLVERQAVDDDAEAPARLGVEVEPVLLGQPLQRVDLLLVDRGAVARGGLLGARRGRLALRAVAVLRTLLGQLLQAVDEAAGLALGQRDDVHA